MQQRLTECVDDLQEVIQEIRTAIFDLHGSSSGVTRLRQRLDEAIAQFAMPDLRTTVQYTGPLSVVDATLADHAVAVVRVAVSNAVRHAGAATLTVNVAVGDDLCIDVVDDGRGIPARRHRQRPDQSASARRRRRWPFLDRAVADRRNPVEMVRTTALTDRLQRTNWSAPQGGPAPHPAVPVDRRDRW